MYHERCKPIAWGVQIGLESKQAAFICHILILRLKTVDQLDEGQRPYANFGTVCAREAISLMLMSVAVISG